MPCSIILHLWGFLCIRDAGCRSNKITVWTTGEMSVIVKVGIVWQPRAICYLGFRSYCCSGCVREFYCKANKFTSHFCSRRYQQSLTMDVIVSAAFGFEVDSQSNPDEPILRAVRQATQQGGFRRILLTIISILPFGLKLMELVPSLWMANLKPLLNISEEIVQLKRGGQGNSPRKVIRSLRYQDGIGQKMSLKK